jgi:hypothetical protein
LFAERAAPRRASVTNSFHPDWGVQPGFFIDEKKAHEEIHHKATSAIFPRLNRGIEKDDCPASSTDS